MDLHQISSALVVLTGALFVAVQAGLLAVLWRRRRRARAEGVAVGLEAAWSLVPAALLILLLLLVVQDAPRDAAPDAAPTAATGKDA